MENQFKPDQPKSIPAKKLIGFFVAWLFCAVISIVIIAERREFYEAWSFWLCLAITMFGVIFIPLKIIQMQKDYRNGRSR